MGADNEAVLAEDAKISGAEIRQLAADGVIGDRPLAGVADRPRPLDIAAGIRRLAFEGQDPDYGAVIARLYAEACP